MTDFLTRLTARSFGTETAIRPRVASLFEPVRNGDAGLRDSSPAEPIGTPIIREIEVESDSKRKMSRPAPFLREDGKSQEAKQAPNDDTVSIVIPQPRGDSARGRTSVLADRTTEREDTMVAAKVRPRRAPLSQDEDANESEARLRSHSEAAAPKAVPARAPTFAPTRNESLDKDHRGLVLPPKVAADLTAHMKNAALAMTVRPAAPEKERTESIWPTLATQHESSVHVTIGRIEVRASSESKPVGRAQPASPVMSLEEYLHRRAQRGSQ
jgi:hypothetical protein